MDDLPIDVDLTKATNGRLSHESIQNILYQRTAFYDHTKRMNEAIWSDELFDSTKLCDRISEIITTEIIESVTKELSGYCDDFIDSIVDSEFHPEDSKL